MASPPRPYRGPLLAGLALFAASCGLAWGYWGTVRTRELAQLERLSGGLVAVLEMVLDPELAHVPEDDASLERLLQDKLRIRRPVLYVTLFRDGRRLATLGEMPAGLTEPPPPGLSPAGDFIVFRYAVGAEPSPPRRDPPPRDPPPDDPARSKLSPPWRWRPAPSAGQIIVVVGCDATLPAQAYNKTVPELAGVLLLSWAGIAALVLAWYRSIRSRDLGRALDAERRERTRLEEMNLAAAGLAHETKNPLGIILGLAQRIARDGAITPETREAAEQIVDAADQAAARLSDFLGFARLASPRLEPVRADVLLGRVVSALQPDFDDAGVRAVLHVPALSLVCAPAMVEQVLVNLLLNALQASAPDTMVTLSVEPQGDGARLVVQDQGRGIPADLLPHVFKPYVTGRADGHGLGLAIVKRIVDQHGWTIHVDSVVGQGTRVSIDGMARAVTGEHP